MHRPRRFASARQHLRSSGARRLPALACALRGAVQAEVSLPLGRPCHNAGAHEAPPRAILAKEQKCSH